MMVVMVVVMVVEGVMGVMAVTAITTPVIATLMMRPKMRQPAVWMSLHGGGDFFLMLSKAAQIEGDSPPLK